jgi:hypothetical protein
MAAVANNPAFAKKAGVPQSVGKEFNNADKGKTFKQGGDTMATTKMGKPVMKKGMSTAKDGMKKPTPMANTSMGMKKGGMAKGGGIEAKGKTKGKMITMKYGGKTC